MVATLPKTDELKIRQTLAQWRQWNTAAKLGEQPVAVEVLNGGLSNTSLLVAAGSQEFVLRLDGHDPQRLGLNRAAEWRSHQNASAAGLAPRPVYFNAELGVLVSEFYRQDAVALTGVKNLRAIAELLRAIHRLPPVKFRLKPLDRAHHYLGLLGETALPGEFEDACSRLGDTSDSCLCHNDLLRENRLQVNNRYVAIDWEYAAMGDPWFDLAVVCEEDQLDEQQCRQLGEAYLRSQPGAEHRQRLRDNRTAYRCLTQLWRRLTGQ